MSFNDRKNEKSFLVEDETIQILNLKYMLNNIYEVVGESKGYKDTSDIITDISPDFVISDFDLEELTAVDILRDLRSKGNKIKTFIVSGYDKNFLSSSGLFEFTGILLLPKPINKESLMLSIELLLRV